MTDKEQIAKSSATIGLLMAMGYVALIPLAWFVGFILIAIVGAFSA